MSSYTQALPNKFSRGIIVKPASGTLKVGDPVSVVDRDVTGITVSKTSIGTIDRYLGVVGELLAGRGEYRVYYKGIVDMDASSLGSNGDSLYVENGLTTSTTNTSVKVGIIHQGVLLLHPPLNIVSFSDISQGDALILDAINSFTVDTEATLDLSSQAAVNTIAIMNANTANTDDRLDVLTAAIETTRAVNAKAVSSARLQETQRNAIHEGDVFTLTEYIGTIAESNEEDAIDNIAELSRYALQADFESNVTQVGDDNLKLAGILNTICGQLEALEDRMDIIDDTVRTKSLNVTGSKSGSVVTLTIDTSYTLAEKSGVKLFVILEDTVTNNSLTIEYTFNDTYTAGGSVVDGHMRVVLPIELKDTLYTGNVINVIMTDDAANVGYARYAFSRIPNTAVVYSNINTSHNLTDDDNSISLSANVANAKNAIAVDVVDSNFSTSSYTITKAQLAAGFKLDHDVTGQKYFITITALGLDDKPYRTYIVGEIEDDPTSMAGAYDAIYSGQSLTINGWHSSNIDGSDVVVYVTVNGGSERRIGNAVNVIDKDEWKTTLIMPTLVTSLQVRVLTNEASDTFRKERIYNF